MNPIDEYSDTSEYDLKALEARTLVSMAFPTWDWKDTDTVAVVENDSDEKAVSITISVWNVDLTDTLSRTYYDTETMYILYDMCSSERKRTTDS